jgi:adenosylmethionine-8-amino-7-oxononanoate aminotransferase
MSVGRLFEPLMPFREFLFDVDTFSYPATYIGDEDVHTKEVKCLEQIAGFLKEHHHETAAVIIEPLVQGVVGMQMCTERFLRELNVLARQYDIVVIYDEVMTGFGRTGSHFACGKAGVEPDIICLAKGLTGGFLPLAVTACSDSIYNAFLGNSASKALLHGHSFTANPLGCAASIALMSLLLKSETQLQLSMIESVHRKALKQLSDSSDIMRPRLCGTIAAFELRVASEYGSEVSVKLRDRFLARGLLIRPFGNVFYLLPPYCITETDLTNTYEIIEEELKALN